MNLTEYLKKYWKSMLWASIIGVLLFIPGNKFPKENLLSRIPYFDKWIHLSLFFGLNILLLLESKTYGKQNIKSLLLLVLLTTLYAIFTEAVQHYLIQSRNGSIADLLADITGIAIATALYLAYCKVKYRFYHENR